MFVSQVDNAGLLAAILPLVLTILIAGLTLAWRLGGLDRKVHDLADDLEDSQRDRRDLRTDITNIRSDVAAIKSDLRDVQRRMPKATRLPPGGGVT